MRLGLDIDGVLACFSSGVIERARKMGLESHFPKDCEAVSSWDMSLKFSDVMRDAWNDPEFWLTLPRLKTATDPVPTPVVYITSRPIPSAVSAEWLGRNGFPEAPVVTVGRGGEKLQHAIDYELDLFVDDLYSTVHQMREYGINAILHAAPYQAGHREECEGLPTIHKLSDIFEYYR